MFDVTPSSGMDARPPDDRSSMRLFWDVCDANDVHPEKVRGRVVCKELVRVRRKAARVLSDAGCSLSEIGRILDRHHTTVMSLLNPEMKRRKYAAECSR